MTDIIQGVLQLITSGNDNIADSSQIEVGSGATLDVTQVSGSGGFILASGQKLSGNGTIYGSISIAARAHLDPGDAIGSLVLGGLLLEPGSILDIGFQNSPAANDFVDVTNPGGLIINGGSVNLYQDGTSTPYDQPGTYELLEYSGALAGNGVSTLSVLDPQPGFTYSFSSSNNLGVVDLTIEPVPEPNSGAQLIFAAATIICFFRRTRRPPFRSPVLSRPGRHQQPTIL